MVRWFIAGILCVGMVMALVSPMQGEDQKGEQPLFNGKDLTGWRIFLDTRKKEISPEQVFSVVDGAIRCEGNVAGYIISEKEYENYELRFEWKWGSKVHSGRNSGCFVHVSGPDKIWPKGVEAQLMDQHAGDFWLVDGFQLTVDKSRQDKRTPRHYMHMKDGVEKPHGEWNQYVVICKGNTIKLIVNGVEQNEGTEAESTKGKILFQSEGAEIFFRNIVLKPL